jgi:hypothetical protein
MAERGSMPVSAGTTETSGRCCKMCQSFVKKLRGAADTKQMRDLSDNGNVHEAFKWDWPSMSRWTPVAMAA